MDAIDLKLCRLLMLDARRPYRELADELGISIAAVHRRIEILFHLGVIKAFTANVSIPQLGAVLVLVFGPSQRTDLDKVAEDLGKDNRTYALLAGSGHYLYVAALLRDISELDGYVESVRDAAGLTDIISGLEVFGAVGDTSKVNHEGTRDPLSPLDLRIISALHANSRKALTDVAREVGISAKTARHRLEQMQEKGMVEIAIQWHPDASGDVISLVQVHLEPGTEIGAAIAAASAVLEDRLVFPRPFFNLPDLMLMVTWNRSMRELKEDVARISTIKGVRSAVPHTIFAGYRYECWRDRMLPPPKG